MTNKKRNAAITGAAKTAASLAIEEICGNLPRTGEKIAVTVVLQEIGNPSNAYWVTDGPDAPWQALIRFDSAPLDPALAELWDKYAEELCIPLDDKTEQV